MNNYELALEDCLKALNEKIHTFCYDCNLKMASSSSNTSWAKSIYHVRKVWTLVLLLFPFLK